MEVFQLKPRPSARTSGIQPASAWCTVGVAPAFQDVARSHLPSVSLLGMDQSW